MRRLSFSGKIFLTVFIGIIFLYSFNQFKESDSFYHLKTGQVIWETKNIPQQDIFSYTAEGRMWVTHEWLAETIFYGAYKLGASTNLPQGGFWGVVFFVALVASLTYLFIFLLALKKGANPNVAAILIFALGYLTFELWIPRPQIFAFLSFSLLIYFLESYRLEGKRLYLLFSVAAIWFWANVNASFLLGLVVMAFYFVSEMLKRFFPEALGKPADSKNAALIGAAAAASIAVSFLNPNGYRAFLYAYYIKPAIKLLQVLEWKPIYFFWQEIQAKIFLLEMLTAIIILFYWFWFKEEKRDATWLGAVLGIFLLPFISIRHVGFVPLIAAAPCAVAVSGIFREKLGSLKLKLFQTALLALFLLLAVMRYQNFPQTPLNAGLLPVRLADFIEEIKIKGPFFNLYNEGGYFIWRFWPNEKVFIDGRSEVFIGAPLDEYLAIVRNRKNWQELIDEKYKINYFVLPYRPAEFTRTAAIMTTELSKRDFALIYWDDVGVLLARKTEENAEIMKKHELKYANPFVYPETFPASAQKAAAEEIQRLIDLSPESSAVQNYARRFLGTRPNVNVAIPPNLAN